MVASDFHRFIPCPPESGSTTARASTTVRMTVPGAWYQRLDSYELRCALCICSFDRDQVLRLEHSPNRPTHPRQITLHRNRLHDMFLPPLVPERQYLFLRLNQCRPEKLHWCFMLSGWVSALYAFQCRFHATRAFISGQETLAAGNRKQATAKATVQLAKARFLPETRCSSVKV